MRLHHQFEWDSKKAASNLRKHGVYFETAAKVLSHGWPDAVHVESFDSEHSEFENRWFTTSVHPEKPNIVITVSWTEKDDETTRIISARYATKKEVRTYAEEIRDRQNYP